MSKVRRNPLKRCDGSNTTPDNRQMSHHCKQLLLTPVPPENEVIELAITQYQSSDNSRDKSQSGSSNPRKGG